MEETNIINTKKKFGCIKNVFGQCFCIVLMWYFEFCIHRNFGCMAYKQKYNHTRIRVFLN